MKNIIRAGTLFAFGALFLALYYRKGHEDELQSRLKKVLSGLLTTNSPQAVYRPKIAVGYGSCKDLVFDAHKILHSEYLRHTCDQDAASINTYDELLNSFGYYFKHGAAAERFTPNGTLFNELLQEIETVSPEVVIGGNAATIARRLVLEGFDVLLAATMTQSSKILLPRSIKVVGETTDVDDTHLIFEYKAEEKWGALIAPRANRFILHHDHHNPRMDSLQKFGIELKKFRPDLFIVSGLQMMDKYPMSEALRTEILSNIREQIRSLPNGAKIHFEMASITDKSLLTQIIEYILPFTDSLGMNEQELANLYSIFKHNKIILAADSRPRVSKTLDMTRYIYRYLQESRNLTSGTSVTRVHVHSLAYQLILVAKNSNWKNTHSAAARTSLIANTYVCGTSEVDIEKSTLVMDESFAVSSVPGSRRIFMDDHKPVTCWNEDDVRICIAPNLVCTNAKQTCGAGDNISAIGLAAQV